MPFDALIGGRPIYQGGAKIEPKVEELVVNDKWLGCKFRSENEIERFEQTCACGSGVTKRGFLCSRLEIFMLNPSHCIDCPVFENKPESKQ